MTPYRVFIGWDSSQMRAWFVADHSLRATSTVPIEVQRIDMARLRLRGLYTRPTAMLEHGYFDELSAAPMSTGHAIARFLVPVLCDRKGWALFTDGDVLFRRDVSELFALADPTKAVQVVQHAYVPDAITKMTGQAQTTYARKNWSSVVLWNCSHPAHRALTTDLVNTAPGRDLHRFCWLEDALIGSLPAQWNALVRGDRPTPVDPAIVHFTEGIPDMPGYEHVPYADDWYAAAARAGYRLPRPAKAVEVLA